MVTARDIYNEVCCLLLEDTGLQFVYSEAAFLSDLASSLAEFMQASGIVRKILTVPLKAGVSTYSLPTAGMEVLQCFADNRHLYDASGFFLSQFSPDWRTQTGTPTAWRADQLDANSIEVSPAPSENGREVDWDSPMFGVLQGVSNQYDVDIQFSAPGLGTIGGASGDCYVEYTAPMFGTIAGFVNSDSNLTIIATAQPSTMDLTLDSPLELIPDSLAPYLTFAALEKIFTADGESKDVQRARYAQARKTEGTNLCKAISGMDLLEKV